MENVCCEVEREHWIWSEQRNIYDFAPKFQLKMDSFKCSLTHSGNHFFWHSSQRDGGRERINWRGKKQYSNDLWASEKWKSRHWQGHFCTGTFTSPDQTRPELKYQQLDCYSGWPPATGDNKKWRRQVNERGSGLAGTAKKWVEKCTAKWKIAQSEWKCWPGIEQSNRSYPVES